MLIIYSSLSDNILFIIMHAYTHISHIYKLTLIVQAKCSRSQGIMWNAKFALLFQRWWMKSMLITEFREFNLLVSSSPKLAWENRVWQRTMLATSVVIILGCMAIKQITLVIQSILLFWRVNYPFKHHAIEDIIWCSNHLNDSSLNVYTFNTWILLLELTSQPQLRGIWLRVGIMALRQELPQRLDNSSLTCIDRQIERIYSGSK